jgi:hypothetical protein
VSAFAFPQTDEKRNKKKVELLAQGLTQNPHAMWDRLNHHRPTLSLKNNNSTLYKGSITSAHLI